MRRRGRHRWALPTIRRSYRRAPTPTSRPTCHLARWRRAGAATVVVGHVPPRRSRSLEPTTTRRWSATAYPPPVTRGCLGSWPPRARTTAPSLRSFPHRGVVIEPLRRVQRSACPVSGDKRPAGFTFADRVAHVFRYLAPIHRRAKFRLRHRRWSCRRPGHHVSRPSSGRSHCGIGNSS
jgi:hypothetical protein